MRNIFLLFLAILPGCNLLSDKELREKLKNAEYTGMIIGYEMAQEEMSMRYEAVIQNLKRDIKPLLDDGKAFDGEALILPS